MNCIWCNTVSSRNKLAHLDTASCLNIDFTGFFATRITFSKTALIVTRQELITQMWRWVSEIRFVLFITFLFFIKCWGVIGNCYFQFSNVRSRLKRSCCTLLHRFVEIICQLGSSWSSCFLNYFYWFVNILMVYPIFLSVSFFSILFILNNIRKIKRLISILSDLSIFSNSWRQRNRCRSRTFTYNGTNWCRVVLLDYDSTRTILYRSNRFVLEHNHILEFFFSWLVKKSSFNLFNSLFKIKFNQNSIRAILRILLSIHHQCNCTQSRSLFENTRTLHILNLRHLRPLS